MINRKQILTFEVRKYLVFFLEDSVKVVSNHSEYLVGLGEFSSPFLYLLQNIWNRKDHSSQTLCSIQEYALRISDRCSYNLYLTASSNGKFITFKRSQSHL